MAKQELILIARPYPEFPHTRWLFAIIVGVELIDQMVRLTLAPQAGSQHAGHDFTWEIPTALSPGSPLHELLTDTLGVTVHIGERVELNPLIGQSLRIRFSPADAEGHQMLLGHKPALTPRSGEKGGSDASKV